MRGTDFERDGYFLYQFEKQDWMSLKSIRLEALREEPGVFGSSFSKEALLSDSSWQERLAAKDRAHFGLFLDNGECVGITGIGKQTSAGNSVVLVASYIKKEHRGRGLSKLFYDVRIDWAKQNGYDKAIVSHRDTNLMSKAANQKAGFSFTHSEERVWPDGIRSNELFYALFL
ncbi:GNAT family N-acetyltransferase [Spirosoma aureum]|uniref:GNAT family N-acetyltransferase n=1 Tax=Spirosoma aureum TaxID=2692134 RepID=A0A6G9AFY9_9BACT|nr:GNAT family N-acetyltransferase [Spirosoma aureum]QIP11229.1 GNAT family N-acetyltransferase [Spirosoma aureum]